MFHIVFCLLALCYVGANAATAVSGGCTITMPTDIPKYEPVILVSKSKGPFELFRSIGQVNTFPVGTVLQLSCLGKSNSFVSSSVSGSELVLVCAGKDQWRASSGNTVYNLADLGCKSIPSSSTQYTGESCSSGQGHILQPGFLIDDNFYPTINICYNNVTEVTYFTHHKLNGASIDYNVKESKRRAFSADGMTFSTAAANKCYLNSNQITRFEALFGKAQTYVSKTTFLARGHLAPDADFIMSYEQLATFYYANAAPEFQDVNAGNWLRVENRARKLASQVGRDLTSWNGYFGKLSLPDSTGKKLIQINLDTAGKMPVPQYYFKVLHDEKTDAAIVFLSYNSPFETSVQEVCPNICAKAGLDDSNYENYQRGYTYCCTLDDFQKVYKDLPKSVSASKLLTASIV